MALTNKNLMTSGIIWKQLLRFLFPILLGTLFQTLYNTIDAIIVGNVLGKEALAAVGGGTGIIINLLIGFFTGLSSGATVIISQHYGAREDSNVEKAIHNAFAIAFWGGIVLSILGFLSTDFLLRVIKTPIDVLPLAKEYMQIYFAGSLTLVMYNIGSGVFRAFGDSKKPLIFLIIGCLTNIILDFVLVVFLNLGVSGAAYATVFSQLLSLILVLIFLSKRNDSCRLNIKDIHFYTPMLKKTLYIGLPSGLQSVLYTVSNLLIMVAINKLGTNTVAAWSAYGKVDALYWMICGAIGVTITTFVGQNYGAGQIKRSKAGVKACFIIAFIATAILEVFLLVFSRFAYRLFTNDAAVIEIGVKMLNIICPFYFTFLFVEIYSGAIRGTGKTLIPTIITITAIVGLRTLWIAILPKFINNIETIVACYPVTWVIAAIAFIIYYRFGNIYDKEELYECNIAS